MKPKPNPGWLWTPARPDGPWRLCSDWRMTHGPMPWLVVELDPSEGPSLLKVDGRAHSPRDQLRAQGQIGPMVCHYPAATGGLSACCATVSYLSHGSGLIRYAAIPGAYGAPVNSCIHRVATWLCQALDVPLREMRLLQDAAGRRLRQVLLRLGPDGFHSPEWRELASAQDLGLLGPSVREERSC